MLRASIASLFLALSSGILVSHAVAADEAAPATQPSVTVISSQVSRSLSPQLARIAGNYVQRRTGAYNDRGGGGVDIAIAVTVPDKRITAIPEDALQIQNFVDDKYTDLGKIKKDRAYYSPSSSISEDGQTCVFSINSERAPDPQATRAFVRGSVTLRCATGLKTAPRAPLQVRIGKTIDAGPVPLTIRSLSESGTGRVLVHFSAGRSSPSPQSTERIRGLRFFGPDGREISTGRDGDGAAVWGTGSLSYQLPADADQVSVEVSYIESIELVTVPFELLLDLGAVKVGPATTQPAPQPQGPRGMMTPRPGLRTVESAAPAPVVPATRPGVWPPPREAVNWPPQRPEIKWPDPRTDVQFPATRPAVEGFAGTVPAKVQRPTTLPAARLDLVSLCVNRVPDAALRGRWPHVASYFRPEGGTVLKLLLSSEDRPIYQVDINRLWIDRFVDNQRGDLSTERHAVMTPYGATSWQRNGVVLGPDARQAAFSIHLQDAPATGATQLLLRGDIVARVGTPEQSAEPKDVELTAGQAIKAGPLTLTIRSVTAAAAEVSPREGVEAGSVQLTVGFQCDKSADLVRQVRFFDAAGKEIPSRLNRPAARFSEGDSVPEHVEQAFNCTLFGGPQRARIKVTYVDRIDTVTIPINLRTGLGI